MTIGPNDDGAELYREHLESLSCPTCGVKESDYNALRAERDAAIGAKEKAEGAMCRAIEVLGFYGDPKSYIGIAMFADPPCGDFSKDYSRVGDDDRGRPGKRAREFLFSMEAQLPRAGGPA